MAPTDDPEWDYVPVDPYGEAAADVGQVLDAARRREASARYHREAIRCHGVTWAEGGDYMRLTTPPPKGKQKGGGQRGEVVGFSRQSRMRLMCQVGKIDQRAVEPRRVWFVTLTYPAAWPTDPARWKRDLAAWRKRLRRVWGVTVALWKIEPQRRGAPHFHLLLLTTPAMAADLVAVGERWKGQAPRRRRVTVWHGGKLAEFRAWCSSAWADVIDGGDDNRRVGTNVEPVESWGKVTAYASKYLGKECQFRDRLTGAPLPIGRYWGVWGEWPTTIRTVELRPAAWAKIRRTVRKLRARNPLFGRQSYLRGRDRSCTVFLPPAARDRLIAWASPSPAHQKLGPFVMSRARSAGFKGTPAEWFNLGESDRQRLHRASRGVRKVRNRRPVARE